MENWWNESVFYEIYMPSFQDFKEIKKRLPYLKELGIDAIWLTPFYKSPKVDNGYDIEDYFEIDPCYGSMKDFEEFINTSHDLGIKVIADLVLNHTSDKHKWFRESKSSIDNPKRDYYIWRKHPNNWESFFKGSAWEFDENTKEYYYHAFAKEQVDLNWTNPHVEKSMFEVMRFWVEKGIDGFRLDVINFLKTSDCFKDNPFEDNKQNHIYDKDQDGIMDLMKSLRCFAKENGNLFLVGEVGSEELDVLRSYSGEDKLHTIFNFNLGSMKKFHPEEFYEQIKNMSKVYKDDLPTLFFSSHDMSRFASRFNLNDDGIKLIATFMLTFKGIPFIYYGDEIAMTDFNYKKFEDMRDIQSILAYKSALKERKSKHEALKIANEESRDKSRNPMQWEDVEIQKSNKNSIFNYYKELIELRKNNPPLNKGSLENLNFKDGVISYMRKYEEDEFLIILNFNNKHTSFLYESLVNKTLAPYETLIINPKTSSD